MCQQRLAPTPAPLQRPSHSCRASRLPLVYVISSGYICAPTKRPSRHLQRSRIAFSNAKTHSRPSLAASTDSTAVRTMSCFAHHLGASSMMPAPFIECSLKRLTDALHLSSVHQRSQCCQASHRRRVHRTHAFDADERTPLRHKASRGYRTPEVYEGLQARSPTAMR